MRRNPLLDRLQRDFGIHLPLAMDELPDEFRHNFDIAMDAQPGLITVSNSGIPALFTTYVDPEVIRILTTPNNAADIIGEMQRGDWTTLTTIFNVVESTGEVASYGDWNDNGSTGANVNYPQRQSYHYQTITQYGERELDMFAKTQLNFISELDVASVLILDKFQNDTYFYGVPGLQCYGLLNDPNLVASIVPITKIAGGTTWSVATANEVYDDVKKLFSQLQVQSKGLVTKDAKMTLALSPGNDVFLSNTNSFNVNVEDLLRKNFPNIKVKTAVQYDTTAGGFAQLILDEYMGVKTAFAGFTEKLRAHGIVKKLSAYAQKKSQGTWGAVIRRPLFIASMLGI